MINLRKAKRTATSSERFLRTLHLQASDPRDKIYGLGFSSFSDFTISVDYTKTVEQVFDEALAVIFQRDFESYIVFKLWEYQRRRLYEHALPFAGTLVEQLAAATIKPSSTFVPRSAIQHALRQLNGKRLSVTFTDDYHIFETQGSDLGNVVAYDRIDSVVHGQENFLFHINRHLHNSNASLDCTKLLKALMGPTNLRMPEGDAVVAALQEHFDGFHIRSDLAAIDSDLAAKDYELRRAYWDREKLAYRSGEQVVHWDGDEPIYEQAWERPHLDNDDEIQPTPDQARELVMSSRYYERLTRLSTLHATRPTDSYLLDRYWP